MHASDFRAFSTEQLRAIEARAIAAAGGDAHVLMARAGAAAFRCMRARWPEARRILVCCGAGNNGGDGYVLARLAREAGLEAVVVSSTPAEPAAPEARRARAEFLAGGGELRLARGELPAADVVVDALLGIGLTRAPEGTVATLIAAMNAHAAPVLALDLPSGLDADRGSAPGACVRADATVTFIAYKRGLATGTAFEHIGALVLETLEVVTAHDPAHTDAVELLGPHTLAALLPPRARTAHKGSFGHVLVVGGELGMAGAALLAAESAARGGAGLVSVATRADNVAAIVTARPELMVRAVESADALMPLLERASVVVAGPGLGTAEWGSTLLDAVIACGRPLVLDADALNLVAARELLLPPLCVLTPHPGEASRLLEREVAALQRDRYESAIDLAVRWNAVVVLKGAGTVIAAPSHELRVCARANPAMASGGMGDVLAGLVGALLAQGLAPLDAASAAVAAHAEAARVAARAGERGMLARDVIAHLRGVLSP